MCPYTHLRVSVAEFRYSKSSSLGLSTLLAPATAVDGGFVTIFRPREAGARSLVDCRVVMDSANSMACNWRHNHSQSDRKKEQLRSDIDATSDKSRRTIVHLFGPHLRQHTARNITPHPPQKYNLLPSRSKQAFDTNRLQ